MYRNVLGSVLFPVSLALGWRLKQMSASLHHYAIETSSYNTVP